MVTNVQDWDFCWCECGHFDISHDMGGCMECQEEVRGAGDPTIIIRDCATFRPNATGAQSIPSWKRADEARTASSKKGINTLLAVRMREQLIKEFPSNKVPKP